MNGRYYIIRLLLTIILSFCVVGYIGLSAAGTLFSEDVYIDIINEEDLAGKARTALEKDFQAEYNTTMIPAEVYMDVITPEWTVKSMCESAQTAVAYITNADFARETDSAALEESITAYFHEYAESIDYEPDEVFDEKLSETIENAETKINSRLDAFYMQTLKDNGILGKAAKVHPYMVIASWAMGAVILVLLVTLILLDRKGGWRRVYFAGTGFFCGGALVAVPAAYLLLSDKISGFAVKDPVVYTAITSLLEACAEKALIKAAFYGIMGLAMIIAAVALNKKSEAETE